MLIVSQCISCILADLESAVRLLFDDEALRWRILEEAMLFLAEEAGRRREPSYYITEVHRILKRVSGLKTPFAEQRRRANEVGLRVAESLTPPLEGLPRFRFLVQWAIAGNHLDFRTVGAGYDLSIDAIEEMLWARVRDGLHVDETEKILKGVKKSRKILYVLDNVGEIAFDKLLIREMQRYAQVVAAVRGGPITSDAVMEDALQVGLDELVPIIVAGPDTLGISLEEMSEDMQKAIATADLIVTKGQANFYVMEEFAPKIGQKIACLFSTKCDPISAKFGLKGKVNIAALLTK
jgi:hypothetical protein